MVYCKNCSLVQLSYVISTERVFADQYTYLTGTTKSLVEYFDNLANELVRKFGLRKGDIVIDIGSNDGTFLKSFMKLEMNVLGIEGSPKPVAVANANGVKTINNFFGKGISELVIKNLNDSSRVKLITAMNVLAHTDNINDFLEEVKKLMTKDTVFVSQSHYLVKLLENLEFDTVYHEHLRYYTLTSLMKLFSKHNFKIFDAQQSKFYGGSILVYADMNKKPASTNLDSILKFEQGINVKEKFDKMKAMLEKNKLELLQLLFDIKKQGKTAVGIGAPMKASTFLNFYKITPDLLKYLAEVNPLKINTISPGVHIPVVDEEIVFREQPDYALILSWNVADDIIKSYRNKGYRGKFIIPIPSVRIIE